MRALGREARIARRDRALSLRAVAAALGVSPATVWRAENGLSPRISVLFLARLFAVVGLVLSARGFAGPAPIRDAPQMEILTQFRDRLHRAVRWASEVAFPSAVDQRRWDGMVSGPGWRYGVEAEMGPQDAQARAGRRARN
jgi:transcriptional regulator with XRE-family HTH domain